jgi:hypothetical protein
MTGVVSVAFLCAFYKQEAQRSSRWASSSKDM